MGKDRIDELTPREAPLAQLEIELVPPPEFELAERVLEQLFAKIVLRFAEHLLGDATTEADVLAAFLAPHEAAQPRARLARDHELLPGGRGRRHLGADDLDLIAVLQLGPHGREPAVDL